MKVHVVFVVLALSGGSGLAIGMSVPDATELVPVLAPAPTDARTSDILVIQPDALAQLPRDAARLPGELLPHMGTRIAKDVERVDRLPTHLLLPAGELIASYDEADGAPLARGVLARDLAPAAPGAPAAKHLASGGLPRTDQAPGVVHETNVFRPDLVDGPAASSSSAVFDPRPAGRVGAATPYVIAGGLALAALAGVGVLLYHRIRPNAALENETRKVIFDAVCMTPGLGVHEISRLAGVSYSTATYHLERLVGAGMLVMTPDGNKLCYYKNGGAFSESERKILPLLKNEEAAKLFEAILDAPGTYRAALAEKLGVTATTINWHLRRLREAGLVDETRAGRSAHLYARLDNLRPTFTALATKVETSEPIIAERLRKYAGEASSSSAVGAA